MTKEDENNDNRRKGNQRKLVFIRRRGVSKEDLKNRDREDMLKLKAMLGVDVAVESLEELYDEEFYKIYDSLQESEKGELND